MVFFIRGHVQGEHTRFGADQRAGVVGLAGDRIQANDADGICSASDRGGDHDTEPPTLEAIGSDVLPKEYASVCVAAVLSRFVLIVTALPMFTDVTETLGWLTPSSKVTVSVAESHCR